MRLRSYLAFLIAVFGVQCGGNESRESQMTYSSPSPTAKLLPVLVTAPPFPDLLVTRVSANVNWLAESVAIGDCHLRPAIPLFEEFPEDRFVKFVDGLDVVSEDGLSNLLIVGGDGDGHTYLFGKTTQKFFVLWHDPDEFEEIGDSLDDFIQWMIRERSDHLAGCPWELYFSDDDGVYPTWDTVWKKKKVIPDDIYSEAKERFSWTHDFVSEEGFELYNQELGFGLRFKNEHRGHLSHLRAVADPRTSSKNDLVTFWQWIKARGFGTEH